MSVFGGARIATFRSVLLLKIPPAISIFQNGINPLGASLCLTDSNTLATMIASR